MYNAGTGTVGHHTSMYRQSVFSHCIFCAPKTCQIHCQIWPTPEIIPYVPSCLECLLEKAIHNTGLHSPGVGQVGPDHTGTGCQCYEPISH